MKNTITEEEKYIGHRLQIERHKQRYTQSDLAALCGVTSRTVGIWEKGGPIPSDKLYKLYENDFDVFYILTADKSMSLLENGQNYQNQEESALYTKTYKKSAPNSDNRGQGPRPQLKNSPNNDNAPPSKQDYTTVPLYGVSAAAGNGITVNNEDIVDSLVFKTAWLRNTLNTNPNNLYLIHVEGESMEPTLRPGDVILVDHSDSTAKRDGIYVIRVDDALLVKRIQRLPGAIIKVSSDNAAYEAFSINISEQHQSIGIIGRVVWTGRRV